MRRLIAAMGKWLLRGPLEPNEIDALLQIPAAVTKDSGIFAEAAGLAPVYICLPKVGKRCAHSGLTRSMLNELILPTERNNFRPRVVSKSVRKHGGGSGRPADLLGES